MIKHKITPKKVCHHSSSVTEYLTSFMGGNTLVNLVWNHLSLVVEIYVIFLKFSLDVVKASRQMNLIRLNRRQALICFDPGGLIVGWPCTNASVVNRNNLLNSPIVQQTSGSWKLSVNITLLKNVSFQSHLISSHLISSHLMWILWSYSMYDGQCLRFR